MKYPYMRGLGTGDLNDLVSIELMKFLLVIVFSHVLVAV